jgi:cytochrome P450
MMTDGARWTSQRNFTVKQLKNFGFGKKSLEGGICEEANAIVDHILSLGDEVKIDSSLFALPVLNVLWNIVAGQSFRRDDARIQELLELNAFAFSSEIFTIAMHAPWIRHVLPWLSGYNKLLEAVDGTKDLFKIQIQEHEKTLNEDNPRDFIDMYLIEMKKNTDPEFNIDQLVMIGHDLISAGSETVATTLNWMILYLTINPEVQEKCYQEIAERVSDGVLRDTEMLHYCQATIAEVQRLSQVAVASVQHRVTKEVNG